MVGMIKELVTKSNLTYLVDNGYLTYYMCLMCMIILPTYVNFLPPFMILWGIFWLLENRSKISEVIVYNNHMKRLFICFLIFYAWQIFGLVFASNLDIGIERILKRLSFLLFPLVLFFPGKMILQNLNKLLRIFVYSSVIFCLFCFVFAFYRSLSFQSGHMIFNPHPVPYGWENYFFGYFLSNHIHPSYLSMYLVLSVIISLDCLFNDTFKLIGKLKWVIILMIFIITIYFLSSRSGVLAIIVIIPSYLFLKIKQRRAKWILLIVLPFFLFGVFNVLKTNGRFNYSFEKALSEVPGKTIIKDGRIPIWKSAISLIRKNFVFGVGTGDATEELKAEYKREGYKDGYYDNLNAHNQYLEIFLENGFIGLVFFIFILGFMIYYSVIYNNLVYGLFVISVMIFFVFETMLNRIAGVTFFPLFSFFLFHLKTYQQAPDI
jgi:O-antigen ligase